MTSTTITSSSGNGAGTQTSGGGQGGAAFTANGTGGFATLSGGGNAAGGTSTGAGGTTATDGAEPGFQPCPESGPCKVLPLGDSITVGLGFEGGYRVELFRLALENDHEITFTGTQSPNGPNMLDGVSFPRNHEGISGETIQQIANRVPMPGLSELPHIVLLHAGTNDMAGDANGADMRLADLMDELLADAPDALIVVSNIIPLPFAAAAVDSFNSEVPGMVETRADQGAHIVYVDQFTSFPTSELGDGVHPNEAGYARMAQAWYEAIAPYLR